MTTCEPTYLTTPLYYLNARPHIGHAYCTVLVDVMARYRRLFGGKTLFLTGTDEHGQKVQQAADKKGITPQAHVDELQAEFRDLWPTLNIDYDDFIRTTEIRHTTVVQDCLKRLNGQGDIYVQDYEGWYSTSAERFFTEEELVDGKCPDTGLEVKRVKERNYFFKMSKYAGALRAHIIANPDFIRPAHRANEVLGFLDKGLRDLCISRPKERLSWGIEIPFDADYVTYVWFDALTNYISALGGPDGQRFAQWWPHAHHYIGKDILTTHSVYWTTMLLALGLPLPQQIVATGWWLSKDRKMSKSLGNVVDPLSMKDVYGPDVLRYYLMRDMVIGQDSDFSEAALVRRNNSDLANDLGNLARRTGGMVGRYFDGVVPAPGEPTDAENVIIAQTVALKARVPELIDGLALHTVIEETMQLVRALNKYVTQTAPFKTIKQGEAGRQAAARSLYTVLEALRHAATLLAPVMPVKMAELVASLNTPAITRLDDLQWGGFTPGTTLAMDQPLFPRRDMPVVAEVEAKPAPAKKAAKAQKQSKAPAPAAAGDGVITFDDFMKVQLQVATVLSAEVVAGSKKLLKLQVALGEGDAGEQRQVVSGIAQHYSAEEMLGKQVVLVANLAPRKIFKIESQGMILAVDTPDGGLALVEPNQVVAAGTRVS